MTLQQLEYIVALDEYRHFVNAADACGVTQSTMSLMIKKLEEELDVSIFDRKSHPVAPTEIGRKVIDKAKVVLFNSKQLVEMTVSQKKLLSGPLSLAMISTVAPILMPGLFKFIDAYPQIDLRQEEMLSSTIISKLKKAEIDMGIVSSPVQDPDILEIPLFHERFLAYVSDSSDLAAMDSIEMGDLRNRPLWVMKDGVHRITPSTVENREDLRYSKMYEGGRVGTLVQIVNENGGVTIIPETHSRLILFSHQKNLKPIVNPEPMRVISLVVRRDYIHEALLNVVVLAVKSILPSYLLEDMIRKEYICL